MSGTNAIRFWFLWACGVVVTVLVLVLGGRYLLRNVGSETASADEINSGESPNEVPYVEVVYPKHGGMNLTTIQPGTVRAFEWADLYAEVSGYLKVQTVDIGDHVKPGQVLAVLSVPDLEANLERRKADLEQAIATLNQMKAQVDSAKADKRADEAQVEYAKAMVRSTEAALKFRASMYKRMKELFQSNSIDARLVDEEFERYQAAIEGYAAAKARVSKEEAKVEADRARIKKAEEDVKGAKAQIKVAQAERDKAQVQVDFATIRAPEWSQAQILRGASAVGLLWSPPLGPSRFLALSVLLPPSYGLKTNTKFDSVITVRNMHVGDFVRAASAGATKPLLRVQRTDLFRVVVMVPDPDVPFLAVGEPATIELTALAHLEKYKKLHAQVSRIAEREDPDTRLMRVEIDLPNTPDGRISDGMFGNVTITLNSKALLTLPLSAVINRDEKRKGDVFVVKNGHVHRRVVEVGRDNGVRIAIRSGLGPNEAVVLYPEGLQDGQTVRIRAQ
jgi:HlyD family secretion protein